MEEACTTRSSLGAVGLLICPADTPVRTSANKHAILFMLVLRGPQKLVRSIWWTCGITICYAAFAWHERSGIHAKYQPRGEIYLRRALITNLPCDFCRAGSMSSFNLR